MTQKQRRLWLTSGKATLNTCIVPIYSVLKDTTIRMQLDNFNYTSSHTYIITSYTPHSEAHTQCVAWSCLPPYSEAHTQRVYSIHFSQLYTEHVMHRHGA